MTENPQPTSMPQNANPASSWVQPVVTTDFLKWTETAEKDALYSDLFQKNADGDIVRKTKTERSMLELFTTIMSFVMPIFVLMALIGGVHVFIRSQEDSSFAENYPFLCGYLNYDIDAPDEEKKCKTAKRIEQDFTEKTEALEKSIAKELETLLPLKVLNSANNTRENDQIVALYNSKRNLNEIIKQFDKIRREALSSVVSNNIICGSFKISDNQVLTTQCTVYWGEIGDDDSKLGSSRIEATRFIDMLAKTKTSSFILETPPTALSVEDLKNDKDVPDVFKTRTTITLSLRYFPFHAK